MIKHVSYALRLKDELTNAPLAAPVAFLLDGFPFTPVRKADGWFVFVNLAAGRYMLEVYGSWFLPEQLQITVPDWRERGAEECVSLRAAPTHPIPAGSVQIMGVVLSAKKQPVQTQLVLAFGRDPIKLLQEQSQAGDGQMKLFLPRKSLLEEIPGLFFCEDEQRGELCTLVGETDGSFRLGEPLRFPHKRGAMLWQARLLRTDAHGHFCTTYPREESPRVFAATEGGFLPLALPACLTGEIILTM